jgi:hypothetical protein
MKTIAVVMLAAMTVGCASAPKGEVEAPLAQLSGLDAKICMDKASVYSALATLRDNKVAKREAISAEMKVRNISKLEKEERKRVTNELYESAIFVYAMSNATPETLRAVKWAECKNMVLNNQSLDYSEIVAIKSGIMLCQKKFDRKKGSDHQACVDGVVTSHSQDAILAKAVSNSGCRTTIGDSIKLHRKAIDLARKGNKQSAITSLEQSMANWKKIANGQMACTSVEKAIAIDGILRASNDIKVVTRL